MTPYLLCALICFGVYLLGFAVGYVFRGSIQKRDKAGATDD